MPSDCNWHLLKKSWAKVKIFQWWRWDWWEENVHFFSFRSETVTDDEALELFKNFDKNGDGFIPHDELKEVLKDVDVNLTDQVQYITSESKKPGQIAVVITIAICPVFFDSDVN